MNPQSVGNAGEMPGVARGRKEVGLRRARPANAISQVAEVWVRKSVIQFVTDILVMRIWN
jgi:hypothetical protein